MATYKFGSDNRPEPDVFEIFEHKFTVKRVTRSVQKKLEATDKKLRSLGEDADGDKVVATISEGLDALLEPNGKATPAKTVLAELWKSEDLDLSTVTQIYEAVQESAAKRPPTSPVAT